MMIWVVGDKTVHSQAIVEAVSEDRDVVEFNEIDAIANLEVFFDDDESSDQLTIITGEESVAILERIKEVRC